MSNLSPVQPQLLSRINEALVLRAIRQNGPSTRGELSQHMGVTFPTVAKAVGSLIDARLLEEFDDVVSGPGRPAKRLRLSKERAQVVGLTIDVQSCEIAAAGFDGVLRDGSNETFATPRSYEELLDTVVEKIQSLDGGGMSILSVGISVVGLVDYRRQEIRLAASLPFLNRKQLGRDLSRRIGSRLRAGARRARAVPGRIRLRRSQRARQLRRARHVHRHRHGRDGQRHFSHRSQRVRRRNGTHPRGHERRASAVAAVAAASKPWPANGPWSIACRKGSADRSTSAS